MPTERLSMRRIREILGLIRDAYVPAYAVPAGLAWRPRRCVGSMRRAWNGAAAGVGRYGVG